MSVEFRAVRQNELEACLDLWNTVWPGGGETYFRRYFYGDVEWLPYYTQVAVEEGRIVSAVQICKRVVACGDFRLTMGGIANVVTREEVRGRGYNSECLKRAITVMEADAMDFSLLFTGIHNYYNRFGYGTVPRPKLSGTIRADFMPRPTPYTMRKAVPADLPAIRALYDVYNAKRPIAVQRYEAYWREWMSIEPGKMPERMFVAADEAGNVVGYLNCGTFRSAAPYAADEVALSVMELGASPADEAAITRALLDYAAARFRDEGMRSLRLDIALETAVLDALEGILTAQEGHYSNSGMARLLHRDNLLRSLTMGLNERWIAAGRPPGAITFQTPYGPTCLDAHGTFLRVMPIEDESETLPQETFFGLLFGTLTPEQTADRTELYPLLTALFPPQAMVYWGADGF